MDMLRGAAAAADIVITLHVMGRGPDEHRATRRAADDAAEPMVPLAGGLFVIGPFCLCLGDPLLRAVPLVLGDEGRMGGIGND